MNKQKKIYNNVTIMLYELSPEEAKIRELTGKELAEDHVGLIITSLVSLSEIISSFFFRNFLLKC